MYQRIGLLICIKKISLSQKPEDGITGFFFVYGQKPLALK